MAHIDDIYSKVLKHGVACGLLNALSVVVKLSDSCNNAFTMYERTRPEVSDS